jgi:transposase, IS6 family
MMGNRPHAIAEKLKRQSKDDFKGRHFEAWLVVQAVTWYFRYPLSYRDLEEKFRERGFEVDHSTINRWVLAYAPMIEKRLRQFRRPQCGSVRIDETYVKIRGKWQYLYRAIDKHGNPINFLLTAKRDLDAAKRFFRKMLKDEPLFSPGKIGTDGANTFPSAIKTSVDNGLLHPDSMHYVTKHLQQGIESDPSKEKHAEGRWLPILQHCAANDRGFRSDAVAEERLWLFRWLDRQRPERSACAPLRTSKG